MKQITKRLKPGEDLRKGIEQLLEGANVQAGTIVSLVGGLRSAKLRMADEKPKEWNENFEIVSATGTVSVNGCHIHISISDSKGNVIGGHLKEGCIIKTTAEIVILVFSDTVYRREPDASTGYDELVTE